MSYDGTTVDQKRARMFDAIAGFFEKGTELLEDVRKFLEEKKREDDAAKGRRRETRL
jgi:hypothetical protein